MPHAMITTPIPATIRLTDRDTVIQSPSRYVASPICPRKRILVFCDGTGQDGLIATNDGRNFGYNRPLYFTNVLRLSRAVKQFDDSCPSGQLIQQIVLYQSGVGTDSDFLGQPPDGDMQSELYGTTVARKIRDVYAFIAQNYIPGDEIFLFGFSRGAYTARKVAGLIDRVGLLHTHDMAKFYGYWYYLETGKGDVPPRPNPPVPIQCMGLWDTVGAIRTSIFSSWPGMVDRLGIPDHTLPANVKHAYHALAFHENRDWFRTTLYGPEAEVDSADRVVKEVWFGGDHADIGGGWADSDLADIGLFWMAGEIEHLVALDRQFLLGMIRPPPPAKSKSKHSKPRWGSAQPHNSFELVPYLVRMVASVHPMDRLAAGCIRRDSKFHPSLLTSPKKLSRPANMLTFDAVREHFDQQARREGRNGWQPAIVELNALEKEARKRWHYGDRVQSTFESNAQLFNLVHDIVFNPSPTTPIRYRGDEDVDSPAEELLHMWDDAAERYGVGFPPAHSPFFHA